MSAAVHTQHRQRHDTTTQAQQCIHNTDSSTILGPAATYLHSLGALQLVAWCSLMTHRGTQRSHGRAIFASPVQQLSVPRARQLMMLTCVCVCICECVHRTIRALVAQLCPFFSLWPAMLQDEMARILMTEVCSLSQWHTHKRT